MSIRLENKSLNPFPQDLATLTSIASALQSATERLGQVSDSPRLDAEIILGLATGKSRTHFLAWPEKQLAIEEAISFRHLLERRTQGHPIAHLTGTREFWSREFLVTPDVLIPRPETELLVELALAVSSANQAALVLDLGTGSGAIAVTIALELPESRVIAVDKSLAALQIARQNAKRLGAANIRFIPSDWFANLPAGLQFDLIVSNPPYVADGDPHLQRGDLRFEPRMALAAGADGLQDIRRIARDAPGHLKTGGRLLFEHGYNQGDCVRRLLSAAGFSEVTSFPDLQNHERVSSGRR